MAVDGTYRVTVEGMGKKAEGTVELKATGSALAGTVQALGMTVSLQDGKVNGQSFTGFVEGSTPMGKLKCKVSGSVAGDKISGKLSAGLMRASFEGTRA